MMMSEAATIYRCDGRAKQPKRPHEESWPAYGVSTYTWTVSQYKQQMQSLIVPACRSLESISKIQGTQKCT